MVSSHAMRQWSASSTQISTSLDGETVILNTVSGRYFSLGEVGSSLWRALQKPHSLDELLTVILERYDVDAGTAAHDVHALLGTLQEAGLVTRH